MKSDAEPIPLPAEERLCQIHAGMGEWFHEVGREYPWRLTRDPYAILVSEVMLQQTQIAVVLGRGYYARWMEQFPTCAALAEAGEDEVLRAWEGLGYYSRARNLQKIAQMAVKEFAGTLPRDVEQLLALPGIGRYTAGAVASFAWDLPAAIVDGNVARVFARWLGYEEEVNAPAGQRMMWRWAEALLDARHARTWNSALMELGQQHCTPRKPACEECPARTWCASAGPEADRLPRRRSAKDIVKVEEHAVWLVQDKALLMVREAGSRRKGLWRLPLRERRHLTHLPVIHRARHAITRHRISLTVYEGLEVSDVRTTKGEVWQPLSKLERLPMSGPLRRVVRACLEAAAPFSLLLPLGEFPPEPDERPLAQAGGG